MLSEWLQIESKHEQVLLSMPPAVQIMKKDWSSKWPTCVHVTDLVKASESSELVCENSMIILKLLSEEVLDVSWGKLSSVGIFCISCLFFCCI